MAANIGRFTLPHPRPWITMPRAVISRCPYEVAIGEWMTSYSKWENVSGQLRGGFTGLSRRKYGLQSVRPVLTGPT